MAVDWPIIQEKVMTHLPSKGKGLSSPELTVSGKDDLRIIICQIVVSLLKIQKEVQTSEQRWIFKWNIKILLIQRLLKEEEKPKISPKIFQILGATKRCFYCLIN